MKLDIHVPNVETSGQLKEQFFSVEDQGMIMDILRNKMYSNPMLAICREISCNARDAHREVKTPEVPIEIQLPNSLVPYLKIKDFGPGISPDRISNIFIKYTASTKRNDNVQLGGFGIGGKTPFSYSDTFSIETIHNGIKYSYACVIDETKVGKLISLSEENTNEPSGTEISMPVNPKDFNTFRQYIEQACRHWDVKPIIKGAKIDWTTFSKILEGKNWAISQSSDWQRSIKLIIDGIEYPLELETLRKYADAKLIDSCRGNLLLYFNIGELSLSASREQIYLDKKTESVICNRLIEIQKEIKASISAKIDNFSNLWDANVYYRKDLLNVFNGLDFLGKFKWKTFDLHSGYVSIGCKAYTFRREVSSYRKVITDPNKTRRNFSTSISFEEGVELYINDLSLKDPTPKHLKKAFESNPLLKAILLICPDDNQSEADLNKLIHLDEMKPKKLSSIAKVSARAYTPSASRLIIFKYYPIGSIFQQISYADMEADTNVKVLCILDSSERRIPILLSKKELYLDTLKSLVNINPLTSFYGISEATDQKRIDAEFSDFQKLDDLIEKNLSDQKIDFAQIKYCKDNRHALDERMVHHINELQPLIEDKDNLFLKRMELHNKIQKIADTDSFLLNLYQNIKETIASKDIIQFIKDNPEMDIIKMNTDYNNKYPLLKAISAYTYGSFIKPMADYINLIDNDAKIKEDTKWKKLAG